jgi:SAM-dependent methyltransferase
MKESTTKQWYGEWFDSPYYHILYKHRDAHEARLFLNNLVGYLKPTEEARFLDVACGKGRHAISLNEMGFYVTGIDLSRQSIEEARVHENESLHFFVHDMRKPFMKEGFDYVLNLFTSFGFFDTHDEHRQSIRSMAENLRPGGFLVLDFLNPYVVINDLIEEEIKEVEDITFHINRRWDGTFIIKEIGFEHDGQRHDYFEKIKAIRRTEFIAYFEQSGLEILSIFGDYYLNPYVKEKSSRMIFLAQK